MLSPGSPAWTLDLLDRGHAEADEALAALKAAWVEADARLAVERQRVLDRFHQGALDRDAKRVALGAPSKLVTTTTTTEETHESA